MPHPISGYCFAARRRGIPSRHFNRDPGDAILSSLVLVIDDDEGLRQSLADFLRAEGCRALTAQDGEDALALLTELPELPSLLLVDLVMPRLNGRGFLQRKAVNPRFARIPVLLLTAALTGAEVAERPDVVGFLRKPFGIDDLAPYVRSLALGHPVAGSVSLPAGNSPEGGSAWT
jgi:CheY-like chemotaxis protein